MSDAVETRKHTTAGEPSAHLSGSTGRQPILIADEEGVIIPNHGETQIFANRQNAQVPPEQSVAKYRKTTSASAEPIETKPEPTDHKSLTIADKPTCLYSPHGKVVFEDPANADSDESSDRESARIVRMRGGKETKLTGSLEIISPGGHRKGRSKSDKKRRRALLSRIAIRGEETETTQNEAMILKR